ncbi:hypothetical protein CAPTEDRAFT_220017 [Capitella teleta]|uniref:Uncharacterized protein n=1 Tax=Capitella teleta TaxID=283909 RepID=R7ULN7_CAPTE|nr:hypothetical protein CAPTEDRAFT_220017 [Capitella teleta]|eukprot:ELU07105.1 hypothetical protein CAPTEDRAFT_220017 [Capitella teleta]
MKNERHIAPMSASNVKKHAARLQEEKMPRRMAHEDCCGFCERYCEGKITTRKRTDIEAWRQDVHNDQKQMPKLIFLRRKSQNTRTASKGSERAHMLSGSCTESSWKQEQEAESPASQVCSRTCSNELLNVITIDDATRIQRHQIVEEWKRGRSPSRRNTPVTSLGQPSGSTLRSTPDAKAEAHGTVMRAIDDAVYTRHVMNNRGLFTHKRACTAPMKESHESGRFTRMNFQLRRMLERQVLSNSPLSQRLQQVTFSNYPDGHLRTDQLPSSLMDGRLTTSRVIAPEKKNFLELLINLDKTYDAVR